MSKEKPIESEISGFISSILRSHFGKGPTSVYVTFKPPFVSIHLKGFLSPIETVLMKQQEAKRVLEIRNLLMQELNQKIKRNFWKTTGLDVKELYTDWNLNKKTGLILGVLEEEATQIPSEDWPSHVNKNEFYNEVVELSKRGQKAPGKTEVYWLNDRMILIKRTEILVQIEKELIKNGYVEELKLSKRPLEHRLFFQSRLDQIMQQPILDSFVDWNFSEDLGYAVLLIQPKKWLQ